MKKTIRAIALFTVLTMLTVGCQKETMDFPQTTSTETMTVQSVQYSIDGTVYHIVINSETEWRLFLSRMIALAEQGHSVDFFNESGTTLDTLAKDVQTFTTTDHDAAYDWLAKMYANGYHVSVTYDEEKGIYTCIAYN